MFEALTGKKLVGYGIGGYYEYVKDKLPFNLDYLCDKNWKSIGAFHDNIPVIAPESLPEIENVFVIIMVGNDMIYRSISEALQRMKIPFERVQSYIETELHFSGKELKEDFPEGFYQDELQNKIQFDETIPDDLQIVIKGGHNFLQIGKNLMCYRLSIYFGSEGICRIGNNTEILGAELFLSYGKIEIGDDCLFSHEIKLMAHDCHHIFDAETGKRINYPKGIRIGNHVWVGIGATLLSGFDIGDNSVIGAQSVTSSTFGSGVVIVGNPAKTIREHICWSKDTTEWYNRESLRECTFQEAEKYMRESRFLKYGQFYIAGAKSRAETLTGQLAALYPRMQLRAYLVDDFEENEKELNGIPVKLRREGQGLKTEYPVLIATKGIYQEQISRELGELGFQEIIPVTPELDNFLRNAYVKKAFGKMNRPFEKLFELPVNIPKETEKACIYVAKSIYDKALLTKYSLEPYEMTIQVGAALTEVRLPDCSEFDNIGDNISEKNRQYSELTALYWIWKHAKQEIVGLAHYRRHFILPQDWLMRMQTYSIDVILPVPTYVAPSIEHNYRKRHDASDWDYLMSYLQMHESSEDFALAQKVFSGNLYSPCNMMIVRKEILDTLCSWMFPILFAAEKHGGIKADSYQNRYLGFLSERLITLFFQKNCNTYKIVYADKTFLN